MLWSDEQVELVSERGLNLVNPQFYYVNRMIVTDIRDDYEAALVAQSAEIERLSAANAALTKDQALLVEISQRWAQLDASATSAARESSATIAIQAAEIERLKAQLAQTWQPVPRSDIKINFFVSEAGRCLVTWPDDIRLCRQVSS